MKRWKPIHCESVNVAFDFDVIPVAWFASVNNANLSTQRILPQHFKWDEIQDVCAPLSCLYFWKKFLRVHWLLSSHSSAVLCCVLGQQYLSKMGSFDRICKKNYFSINFCRRGANVIVDDLVLKHWSIGFCFCFDWAQPAHWQRVMTVGLKSHCPLDHAEWIMKRCPLILR